MPCQALSKCSGTPMKQMDGTSAGLRSLAAFRVKGVKGVGLYKRLRAEGVEFRSCMYMEFPKIRGTIFWWSLEYGSYYLGYYIRVPYFRKLPCRVWVFWLPRRHCRYCDSPLQTPCSEDLKGVRRDYGIGDRPRSKNITVEAQKLETQ